MTFEEWYAAGIKSPCSDIKDGFRQCWHAAWQSAAEAQRISDARSVDMDSERFDLVTEKPE